MLNKKKERENTYNNLDSDEELNNKPKEQIKEKKKINKNFTISIVVPSSIIDNAQVILF